MRRLVLVLTLLAFSAIALPQAADARCPIRADSLEDFKPCMAPMRGTIGTTTVYDSGKYDRDHAQLVSAMMRSQTVAPQVIAPTMGHMSPYSSPAWWMNLYFAGHSSYRNNWIRFASFYYPFYGYNPNVWMYASYRY